MMSWSNNPDLITYLLRLPTKLTKTFSFTFQVSNMFIMSLAIADLTVGLIVMPISSAYAITGIYKSDCWIC